MPNIFCVIKLFLAKPANLIPRKNTRGLKVYPNSINFFASEIHFRALLHIFDFSRAFKSIMYLLRFWSLIYSYFWSFANIWKKKLVLRSTLKWHFVFCTWNFFQRLYLLKIYFKITPNVKKWIEFESEKMTKNFFFYMQHSNHRKSQNFEPQLDYSEMANSISSHF